jgi:protein translocase SEC61 complex gamma subunit
MSKRYPKYEKYRQGKKKKKKSLYEKTVDLYQGMKRVIKTANKPGREDYFMVFKIVAIGILILGGLSYVIQLILSVVPIGA